MEKEMKEEEVNSVYNNYYFKVNKKLQIYAGLWPYEPRLNKLIPKIVLNVYLFVAVIPLFIGFNKWCGVDLSICGENILGICYAIAILIKYWVTSLSECKLKNLYKLVANNWMKITDPDEHAILIQHAKQGRLITLAYLVFMIAAALCFCQTPVVPIILDYLIPLNESRPPIPFVKGEYIFDPVKHFFKLYVFFVSCSAVCTIATTSIDTTYAVLVHQTLGLFSIVKHRLHLATSIFDPSKDINYETLINAIHMHKQALQFIDVIETSYRYFFLVILIPTILFISIGVIIIIEQDTLIDLFRFLIILFGVILHFLYFSIPGQKIMDTSDELFLFAYTNEWYNVSERSKKLLKFLMMRCVKPCVFTAGGLYVMNLENFGSMLKSAVSYIAVVGSFR